MSTENIAAFFARAENDSALAEKITATETLPHSEKAAALASLSAEAGTPFTAEDIVAYSTAISDEALAEIAGGRYYTPLSHEDGVRRREQFDNIIQTATGFIKEYAPKSFGISYIAKLFS